MSARNPGRGAAGYAPFGEALWQEGSTESAWGFTGEWWDASAELLYLRARWYQPYLNRFTSPDPVAPDYRNPQSTNGYVYVLNDPINLTDPAGLYSIREIKEFFDAPFYDLDVLDYFNPGGYLEGRWGWLKVLSTTLLL